MQFNIGNSHSIVSALDLVKHEVKWNYQTGVNLENGESYGFPSFPVVDKRGHVYIGSMDGYL